MKKKVNEKMILGASVLAGLLLIMAGIAGGFRFTDILDTPELSELSAQLAREEANLEQMELRKDEMNLGLTQLDGEINSVQEQCQNQQQILEEYSKGLSELEDYRKAMQSLMEEYHSLILVADISFRPMYDFERTESLSNETNLLNSVNGMFGNVVTDIVMKDFNDSKNKPLSIMIEFNREVEPVINNSLKLIEDSKNIRNEIYFFRNMLQLPEDSEETLLNLRLVKEHYGGLPSEDYYREQVKSLLPAVYQNQKQFQIMEGAYLYGFQNPDSSAVHEMSRFGRYFYEISSEYGQYIDKEWNEYCLEVQAANDYVLLKAYKTLIDRCIENWEKMPDMKSQTYQVQNEKYGNCQIRIFGKKIYGESKIMYIEDQTENGEKLGGFYYDYNGQPIYFRSYADNIEAYQSNGILYDSDGSVIDSTLNNSIYDSYSGIAWRYLDAMLHERDNLSQWLSVFRFQDET